MNHRTAALYAAALSVLPLGHPLLLGALGVTTATTAVVLQQSPAIAQDASAVARIAQAITVRIEGSTQGSGVIVKREGNRYTVLTAWHVVRSTRAGEEVGIYTPDGKVHQFEQGSIQQLGQVDMALLTFSSSKPYEVASLGDIKSVSSGNPIFVSGFPLPTSAVPSSIWRFLDGKVVANATVAIPDGYQLLYSNPTLPGMSGGSVLNSQGQLVGIHGRAERDDQVSLSTGKAVSTGTNQAVPISYYRKFVTGQTVVASASQATTADDYLAQAKAIAGRRGKAAEVISLSNKSIAIKPTADGFFYRAYAKMEKKDYNGAINDLNKAISINPQHAGAHLYRGMLNPSFKASISDYSRAIAINPDYASAYYLRSVAKNTAGDSMGACSDMKKAAALGSQSATYNLHSEHFAWCIENQKKPSSTPRNFGGMSIGNF